MPERSRDREREMSRLERQARRQGGLRAQRAAAEEDLDEQTRTDIDRRDLRREGGRYELTRRAQREEAAAQLDEEIERAEVDAGDVERTDRGFRATRAIEREAAAAQLSDQTGRDVDPRTLERTDSGAFELSREQETKPQQRQPEPGQQARNPKQAVAAQLTGIGPDDIERVDTDAKGNVEDVTLTQEARVDRARQQLSQGERAKRVAQESDLSPDEIARVDITDSGAFEAQLTEKAQKRRAAETVREDLETNLTQRRTEAGGYTAPGIDPQTVPDALQGDTTRQRTEPTGIGEGEAAAIAGGVTASDITDSGELSEDAQRDIAAAQLDAQTEEDITREQVAFENGQAQLTEETRRVQAAEALNEQVPVDVGKGDVVFEGDEARLRDGTLERAAEIQAARGLRERLNPDVPASVGGFEPDGGEDLAVSIEPGEDVVADAEGGDVDVTIRDELEREIVAARVARRDDLEPGEDFSVEQSDTDSTQPFPGGPELDLPEWNVDLTEAGQERLQELRAEAEDYKSDDILDKAAAVGSTALASPVAQAAGRSYEFWTGPIIAAEREIFAEGATGRAHSLAAEGVGTTVDATANAPGISQTIDAAQTGVATTAGISRVAYQRTVEDVVKPASESTPLVSTGFGPATEARTDGNAMFADSEVTSRFAEGASTAAADLTVRLPANVVELGGAATEAGEFTIDEVQEEGSVVAGAEDSVQIGAIAAAEGARRAARGIERNPVRSSGMILGGAATAPISFAATGRTIGTVGRFTNSLVRDRSRTVGGTRVPPEVYFDSDVRRTVEQGGAAYPSSTYPELYRTDPVEAIRRQSRDETPDILEEDFDELGVSGTTLSKALDVEPETGSVARAGNFRTVEGDYENPGAFFGPEPSPRFTRVNQARDASFSWRPGLPDFDMGPTPTFIEARTRVRSPDADTKSEFDQELLAREGETGAFTRPPDIRTSGEAQALVPPGAQFYDINTGPVRDQLRRLGVGSDYYTELGGRRVPIRLVAPDDELGTTGRASLLSDVRGQSGAGAPEASRVSRSFESSRTEYSQPVDRPVPTSPVPSSTSSTAIDSDLDGSSRPFSTASSANSYSTPSRGVSEPILSGGSTRGAQSVSQPLSYAESYSATSGGSSSVAGSSGRSPAPSSSVASSSVSSSGTSSPATSAPASGTGASGFGFGGRGIPAYTRPPFEDDEDELEVVTGIDPADEDWESPILQADEVTELERGDF